MKNENEQLGKFSTPAEVRIVRTLPGPIERVWDYLVDPEKRSRWFAGGPMELRPGGKVTFQVRYKNLAPDEPLPEEHKDKYDSDRTMTGTVTRCEPPRVLAFTFSHYGESEATFELTPKGKDVVLVLTQRGTGEDLSYMVGFASGWHTHLAHLIALLNSAARPPFWSLHAKLKEDYEKLFSAANSLASVNRVSSNP